MISIKPLGSSSAGNAYLVSDGTTRLLLEAGLNYRSMQIASDFRMTDVEACLISHEHLDHCKAVRDLVKRGFDVYASAGTWGALGITHYRAHIVEAQKPFTVGTWTIMPFDVEHDVSEPMGFLLANSNGEKLVFITDSYYCRYRFSGLTHVMIETNYSSEILRENVESGRVPQVLASRLLRSHMSLETAIEFLKANDLSRVQEIFLIHLSSSNSDEAEFKRKVQQVTGKQVFVAQEGGR